MIQRHFFPVSGFNFAAFGFPLGFAFLFASGIFTHADGASN